jgi:hypothetical protein
MPKPTMGILAPSSRSGCYAIHVSDGVTLENEDCIEIFLADQWLAGKVKQSQGDAGIYVAQGGAYAGYFVILDRGGIVGLCTGMEVRLR